MKVSIIFPLISFLINSLKKDFSSSTNNCRFFLILMQCKLFFFYFSQNNFYLVLHNFCCISLQMNQTLWIRGNVLNAINSEKKKIWEIKICDWYSKWIFQVKGETLQDFHKRFYFFKICQFASIANAFIYIIFFIKHKVLLNQHLPRGTRCFLTN